MYFAVNKNIEINGKAYTPYVCYEISKDIVNAVVKLVREGKARYYKDYTFFANGKEVAKKSDSLKIEVSKPEKKKGK